jgi:hypothetical protein
MLRFVSRDANITQFFGVALRGDDMMLVVEYMEVGRGDSAKCWEFLQRVWGSAAGR